MPKICVGKPDKFGESEAIEKILVKSFLWLEALSMHWKEGKPLSAYLANDER